MKKLLNLLLKLIGRNVSPTTDRKNLDVETVVQNTLRDYKKTFIDLARYDRGERISDSLSG